MLIGITTQEIMMEAHNQRVNKQVVNFNRASVVATKHFDMNVLDKVTQTSSLQTTVFEEAIFHS